VIPDEPYIANQMQYGTAPPEYIDAVLNKKGVRFYSPYDKYDIYADGLKPFGENEGEKEVFIWKCSAIKYAHAVGQLIAKRHFYGYISMVAYFRPITWNDLRIFEFLCSLIAIDLWQKEDNLIGFEGYKQDTACRTLLVALCKNEISNPEVIQKKFESIKISFSTNLYVICIRTNNPEDMEKDGSLIMKMFESLFHNCYALLIDTQIVLFIHTKDIITPIIIRLEAMLKEYSCYAGVSTCFHDIADLNIHYCRTSQILDIAESFNI
jgi:hypothetical protein